MTFLAYFVGSACNPVDGKTWVSTAKGCAGCGDLWWHYLRDFHEAVALRSYCG